METLDNGVVYVDRHIPIPLKVVDLETFARERAFMGEVSLATGTFDLLHVNHITALYTLAEHTPGSKLVVALDTDEWAGWRKPGRPFQPFEVRAAMLALLPAVDFIIPHDGDNHRLITNVLPNYMSLSYSTKEELPEDRVLDLEDLRACGGVPIFMAAGNFEYESGIAVSTSATLEVIRRKMLLQES